MTEVEKLTVSIQCDVADVAALWDAAAAKAADDFAMMPDDVTDTIGLREAPDIQACVAMLLDAVMRLGGIFEAIRIEASTPSPGTQDARPALPRKTSRAIRPPAGQQWLDASYAA